MSRKASEFLVEFLGKLTAGSGWKSGWLWQGPLLMW
jgi:hypothetical protein